MKIKAVLFDLDGTLLPMDNKVFAEQYFGSLSKWMGKYGYEQQKFLKTIRLCLNAMINNDGQCSNEEVFWKNFCNVYGENAVNDKPRFEEYYETDFQKIKNICTPNKKVKDVFDILTEKGIRIIIATNPVFPRIATQSRLSWAGIEIDKLEMFTTYENSSFCKPNTMYYKDLLSKLGLEPQDCLMVGNDVEEDMIAKNIGMNVFLLTDYLISRKNTDISDYNNGNFDELVEFIEKI